MKQPLFSVGEKVILQSNTYPHLNGICHVDKLLFPNDVTKCNITDIVYRWDSPIYCYVLHEITDTGGDGFEIHFKESALHKFQDPSGDSFKEMMYKLKNVKTEEFI